MAGAKPRTRRRRPPSGDLVGDEAPAPEGSGAPADSEGAPASAEDGTGAPASGPRRRARRPRPPRGAASEGEAEAGVDAEAEECTGMLLADMVEGSPALAQELAPKGPAKRRKAKRKAKTTVEPAAELEPPTSSDDEAEAAAGSKRLLEAMNRLEERGARHGDRAAAARRGPEVRPESEFHAGAAGEEVTMDDLLAPLTEAPSFGDVRRQLQGLSKTEPMPEPAPEKKRSQEERRLEYERSSKNADKWRRQIHHMQRSDQVVLGEAPKEIANMSTLAQDVAPQDDFEKELAEITRAAGAAEEDLQQSKALPPNPRIRDELQRQQVGKLKALLFREQQASKRVKKIKSKAYHRIQRRAEARERETLLERLDSENPELAKTLRADYEKKYAEKRMLRQRNARRKWAQTMNRFAKGDKNAQREVAKQAQDAHDEERGLRRAIRGQNPDQSDDSEAVDLSGTDSEGEGPGKRSVARQTIDKAKKLTVNELKDLEAGGELPTTGILGMNFMRNAIKERRESAKKEAEDVLKELQGMNTRLDDADADADTDEDNIGSEKGKERANITGSGKEKGTTQSKTFTAEELAVAREEVDKMFEEEDLAFDCSVSGPLTVRGVSSTALPQDPNEKAPAPAEAARSSKTGKPAKLSKSAKAGKPAAPQPANPWLDVGLSGGISSIESALDSAQAASPADGDTADLPAETEPTALKKGPRKTKKKRPSAESAEVDQEVGPEGEEPGAFGDVLSVLNADSQAAQEQRDLVRTAFVEGTQADDFDEQQDERDRKKEEREAEPQELAGWGHWTGEGAPVRKPKRPREEKPPSAPEGQKAPDAKRPRVQFYEGDKDRPGKYFVDQLPYGMTSAQQYNAKLKMPIGVEWTGLNNHIERIKPKTFVKVGGIVPPLEYMQNMSPQQRQSALKTWAASKQPKRLKARM